MFYNECSILAIVITASTDVSGNQSTNETGNCHMYLEVSSSLPYLKPRQQCRCIPYLHYCTCYTTGLSFLLIDTVAVGRYSCPRFRLVASSLPRMLDTVDWIDNRLGENQMYMLMLCVLWRV